MRNNPDKKKIFDWIDPIKALALLGIMLNHLIERFGSYPWFTNPSNDWPGFQERIHNIIPAANTTIGSIIKLIGWLGDSGPGVFILLSGFGLTWSALNKNENRLNVREFYFKRLWRIYPVYIVLHFIFLSIALIFSSKTLNFANPKVLLSLLGLRYTPELFYFINPSWWFVWLILQLYLIFPILYNLLKKLRLIKFIIITFSFSFISRLYGLLFSQDLSNWMQGAFGGTRLGEFAFGMALAFVIYENYRSHKYANILSSRYLYFSIPLYLVGLFCSITYIGSIFSSLMIAIGLTGIFYLIWDTLIKQLGFFKKIIIWLGVESYTIFLFHQFPLNFIHKLAGQIYYRQVIIAILILLVSIPMAWLINRFTNYLLEKLMVFKISKRTKIILFTILILVFAFFLTEPLDSKYFQWAAYLGASFLLLMVILEFKLWKEFSAFQHAIFLAAITFLTFTLFVFPPGKNLITILIFSALVGLSFILFEKIQKTSFNYVGAIIFSIFLLFFTEKILKAYFPAEVEKWGEYPILTPHPTRFYSLKPDTTLRLKYNNYDYSISTNSYGLTSPDIPIQKEQDELRILILGDAFSMPEGVEYSKSYPAILQKLLCQNDSLPDIKIINGGVTGYGPVEETQQLLELGLLFKPDIVLYQFFIDEFTQALITREERYESIGFVSNHDSIYFLSDIIPFGPYISTYAGRLKSFIKENLTGIPSLWRYEQALLTFYENEENEIYSSENLFKLEYYLNKMKGICEELSAKFIVCYVPGAVEVIKVDDLTYFPWNINLEDSLQFDLGLPFRHFQQLFDKLRTSKIDLRSYLKNHDEQPPYFNSSWHWNEIGHQLVAHVIYENLLNSGVLRLP